jgi:hypothetical protein
MEKLVQPGEGGGALPPPFTISTITNKIVMSKGSKACPSFRGVQEFKVFRESQRVKQDDCIVVSSDFDIFLEIQYASCVFGLALKS